MIEPEIEPVSGAKIGQGENRKLIILFYFMLSTLFYICSFSDLFCHNVEHGSCNDLDVFALICWNLWVDARNKMILNGLIEKSDDILARTYRTISSYQLITRATIDTMYTPGLPSP